MICWQSKLKLKQDLMDQTLLSNFRGVFDNTAKNQRHGERVQAPIENSPKNFQQFG